MSDINIFDATSARIYVSVTIWIVREGIFFEREGLASPRRQAHKGRWLSDFLSVRMPCVRAFAVERKRAKRERGERGDRERGGGGGGGRARAIKARPNKYKR